jgi:hypothetical protein
MGKFEKIKIIHPSIIFSNSPHPVPSCNSGVPPKVSQQSLLPHLIPNDGKMYQ